MTQTKTEQREYKDRYEMVLGIFVAGAFGFILNLFSNLVYDVWVTGDKQFADISPSAVNFIFYGFILTEAFLEFLIYDYKNEPTLNKNLGKRFLKYIFTRHWFMKGVEKATKWTLFIIKWTIWSLYVVVSFFTAQFEALVFLLAVTAVFQLIKYYKISKKR